GAVDPTLFTQKEGKDILLNYKEALKEACWIEAMQKELHEFDRLEIIKKYGMETSDPVDTPIVKRSKLDADSQGKEVDPIRLWYLMDSCIALIALADADYVGCQDTRRSTSGSMQLLGDRLTMDLDSTKFLCNAIIKVPFPYAVTTSNTPDPSILTSDTTSS
nr:hypothetical protein [Tanacetum cinerariifolium]